MKFGYFTAEGLNQNIRYLDGTYDLLPEGTERPLTAVGQPCDQEWAKPIQKRSLIITETMAKVLYGIPDDVEILSADEATYL